MSNLIAETLQKQTRLAVNNQRGWTSKLLRRNAKRIAVGDRLAA